jgi:hypothetical protein
MSKLIRFILVLVLLGSIFPVDRASAQTLPPNCSLGEQENGAQFLICLPYEVPWNGDLVVYAHGYVAPNTPIGFPWSQLFLPDGTPLFQIINGLGYAFAASSYSKNGLAVTEGLADTLDLVEIFRSNYPLVNRVFLTGVSEGGLIAALGVEQHSELFAGGLAACGPVGDFRKQIDHIGDARTVFDYFFPGVLPPSPIAVPDEVMQNWETTYTPAITGALAADPSKTSQFLRVTRLAVDPTKPETAVRSTLDVLWYNVFATNDAVETLGGQPYDNMRRIYFGSNNDLRLNRLIARFPADPEALAEISASYQTSGQLISPLVNLHTIGDPVVPYWHANLYGLKVLQSGSIRQYIHIPIFRYGHCNFKPAEVLFAFALMVYKSTGHFALDIEASLPEKQAQQEYMLLAQEYGLLEPQQHQLFLSNIQK